VRYDNESKPFLADDQQTKAMFVGIVEGLHEFFEGPKKTQLDNIITNVFFYPTSSWEAEMIVRVMHLKMTYRNNKEHLNQLLGIHCVRSLFNFFRSNTVDDLVSKRSSIRHLMAVKEINNLDGLVSEIKESRIESSNIT
jgi:hypothetical protein